MDLECQLVHAEPGKRVVQARALSNGQILASALGEGATAEEAEDRAIERLTARLNQPTPEAQPTPQPFVQAPAAVPAAVPPSVPAAAPVPGEPPAAPPALTQTPTKLAAEPIAEPSLPAIPVVSGANANASASGKPAERVQPPAEDPEDWSSELARLDLQLQRLGWSREQEGLYLERAFGHPSRNRLTHYGDLLAYLTMLESLGPGADPSTASVPLRRRDLLGQCDQLLGQLQWDAATGRAFLEQHFSLTSRQQLSDPQLLQFNMLLEGELMGL